MLQLNNKNNTLHRNNANILYTKKSFNSIKINQLEVHHIKKDQKLNNFTSNLFVCKREEHKKIHNELRYDFSEEGAVKEIIKYRKKNNYWKSKINKYDDKDTIEEKDEFLYGKKKRKKFF